jgi:hypothetical protein
VSTTDTSDARRIVQSWLKEARCFGERDSYEAKRGHPRYTWNRTMELQVEDTMVYVRSRDICETGIGLVCRGVFKEGAAVRIRRNEDDPWVPARVAHVTQTLGAYKVGVELQFEF